MKICSLQENLKKGLITVSHIAGKNINLPILNNILIRAMDGNIKLITTNLEIGITHTSRGKIEEEGDFTVDSKIINDYISLLPNKRVNVVKEKEALQIECENFKTKINGQPAEEFPLIPVVEKNNTYLVDVEEFRKTLSQVVFAVSANGSRLELSGVFLNFKADKLIMAATDSYRLAERELKIITQKTDEDGKKIIVPARTIQELIRILSNSKEGEEENKQIEISVSENQILFTIGSTELVSRLIEGQYPDYKQIIPTNFKTKAIINKNELSRAIKASAIFSKIGVNDVNLDFPKDKNQVIVSSISGQTGESVINLNAEVSGEDNGVVVNYRYLLDGLNSTQEDNVVIEIIDNNTPCVLKLEKEKNYLYIIMPIKQ